MPDQDTIEFVARLIVLTMEDRSMNFFQKARYILWLLQVTNPAAFRPILF